MRVGDACVCVCVWKRGGEGGAYVCVCGERRSLVCSLSPQIHVVVVV